MKRILLSLIAFAGVWMTAGAQTEVEGYNLVTDNTGSTITLDKDVTLNGKTCYMNNGNDRFTLTSKRDVETDDFVIKIFKFKQDGFISTGSSESTTVDLTWSTSQNYYIAVSKVNLTGRSYISCEVKCDIDGQDEKKINTSRLDNTDQEATYATPKNTAPIELHYAKNGRSGVFPDAGYVYIVSLKVTYNKFHYTLNFDKLDELVSQAGTLYDNLSDESKGKQNGVALNSAVAEANTFKTYNENTVVAIGDQLRDQLTALEEKLQAAINAFSCTLNENNPYEATDKTFTSVKVERKMKGNGIWNTLCLPFNASVPEGWIVKELESVTYDSGTYDLKFKAVEAIEAGKPYIAKVGSNIDDYTFENAEGFTLVESPASVEVTAENGGKASFIGSYEIFGIAKDDDNFVIDNENRFHLVDIDNVKIKGFRGYFHIDESNVTGATGVALYASFDNEETGITSVNENAYENVNLYNIAGQRVGENAKGIIIKNGKKYFVK